MNSSSVSLIIRCLGENSDGSLVRIYTGKMETANFKLNRLISMYYSFSDILFLL